MVLSVSSARRVGAVLLTLFCVVATAQDSRLLNISANGFIANRSEVIFVACAIVRDSVTFAVFAEARANSPNLDPAIQVRRLANDQIIAENNDFGNRSRDSQLAIASLVGRVPARDSDAAVLITRTRSVTSPLDDPICVIAVDATGGSDGGLVNIQIQQTEFVAVPAAASAPGAAARGDYRVLAPAPEAAFPLDEATLDRLLQPWRNALLGH